jgi:hypothetical protein
MDRPIHLSKANHCVFMCMRAIQGDCQYAVCHECHESKSKDTRRSRRVDGRAYLSNDDLNRSCHHKLCHLQLQSDLWWCRKDYVGKSQWLARAKGCAFCERTFVVGDV